MKFYLKSIVATIIAFLGSLLVALGDNTISAQEWITATIVGLTALGTVWAVPNKEIP